ncbi:hypothetical protein AVBRAN12640_04770 [Campylobacter sp. RM12640]|uniref:hypothetical protein n=1 Tax=unclassified Campylobacter TaxID=2593542 RepID=UPI0030143BAD|nr:hypothetical protein [Campylobacter sp. RM12640]MBZ7988794.1 hypothetical protein [Campylobacter sp. RM12635]
MHFIYTLLYLSIFASIFQKLTIKKKIFIYLAIIFLTNISIFNGLSLNDYTYSIFSNLSIFSVLILLLIIFNQGKLLDFRAYVYIFVINLLFFLSFLNIITFDICYENGFLNYLIIFVIFIISYLLNQILSILFLLSLAISFILGIDNINDCFFDIFILIFSFFQVILKAIKKNLNKSS